MVWLKISATERDLENHQKLPNFAGSLWPSHLTKIWSWGTNGKRISISFIWYLVMQNISIILATLTTFTTRGQTENEKMGSDMSISSEVPASLYQVGSIMPRLTKMFDSSLGNWAQGAVDMHLFTSIALSYCECRQRKEQNGSYPQDSMIIGKTAVIWHKTNTF